MGSTHDVCVSVGYAGFYGLSLIVDSYALLFVSMAAHATQFAFLALFENPRTLTLLFSLSRERTFPYVQMQLSNDYMENASSLQNANPSLLRRSIPPTCRCFPARRCHPTQPLFLGHIRLQRWYFQGNGHQPRWTRV